MPFRQVAIVLCAVIAVAVSGCCARGKPTTTKPCPCFVSQRGPLAVADKPEGAGVTTDFSALPDYQSAQQSLLAQVASDQTIGISLEETICLAARNSELAEVIDQERHLLQCQAANQASPDRCGCSRQAGRGIDIVLQGEALEQRNSVAGAAAEAFLGLVQVSLQLELIDESRKHLLDLQATIEAADEAGFATAEGKNELQKANLRVDRLESELAAVHQRLTYQLNLLINPEMDSVVVFQPVHDIRPVPVALDVAAETSLAETNRPGVLATETVIQLGDDDAGVYQLLNLFDARLGVQLTANPIKKRLLRRQLIEFLKTVQAKDATATQRRSQVAKVVQLRKREARVSAAKAMLEMQTAIEALAISNSDIQRLDDRAEVLEASKKIDARDAYLKLNENWLERQEARSGRVKAALEYETAKVKLQQAQGLLVQSCGYTMDTGRCQ